MRESLIPILRHPGRSALLVVTFALGFASVLAVVATIEGGRQSIRSDLMALGPDVIACLEREQVIPLTGLGANDDDTRPLDAPSIAALREELGDDVRAVIPLRMELVVLRDGLRPIPTTLMATSPAFEGILRAGLLAGRFLDDGDLVAMRSDGAPIPAVVDEALAREFDTEDPASIIGRDLPIIRGGRPAVIRPVGVFRDPLSLRKHLEAFDSQGKARSLTARRLEFKSVYLPFRPESDAPSGVLVQLLDPDEGEVILPRLETFLERAGHDPFIYVQKTFVDSMIEIVDRFSSISHFIWVVDLLVVVILCATISLLSVEERFPEVALRRAEGASRAQVVWPLLGEATILALLSMPIGYAIGWGILEWGIRPILDWPPYLPPLAVWGTPLSVLVAAWLAHGLPARRIARLDPARVLCEHRD